MSTQSEAFNNLPPEKKAAIFNANETEFNKYNDHVVAQQQIGADGNCN